MLNSETSIDSKYGYVKVFLFLNSVVIIKVNYYLLFMKQNKTETSNEKINFRRCIFIIMM